eukprot:TRINITY_DN18514_c0_g1_i2.p1 TRINITY_DN18514_c0_g1~~TRINITY_DN18514_c0_g1_i2.p1  ORF type:complete len:114 (-),score=22.20 TRINITY_DN18514_c0_g1_i2:91-405(-)
MEKRRQQISQGRAAGRTQCLVLQEDDGIYSRKGDNGSIIVKHPRNVQKEVVESAGQGMGSVTRYTVNVLQYNYDVSVYGFREFFKKHDVLDSRKDARSDDRARA